MTMESVPDEVWVTGIGLVSSIGEGTEAHWQHLNTGKPPIVNVDEETLAPFAIHPQVEIDLGTQIPKRGDQRQMGSWQRLGTYAAGLALTDADLAHKPEFLSEMNLVVAAGAGRRDEAVDTEILEGYENADNPAAFLNESLSNELRPTLFLAQLTNLLAGNISIVHGVTGTSRTVMGEEIGGITALQTATRQIQGGQGNLFLVGGAYFSERLDMILTLEMNDAIWKHPYAPVWARDEGAGGTILGAAGAFLVLESRQHAEARGAKPYARINSILGDRCPRNVGESTAIAKTQFEELRKNIPAGPLAILTGASGIQPATNEERLFLEALIEEGFEPAYRAYGSIFGQSVEAHFPVGVALAAMALSKGKFYQPFDTSGYEKTYTGDSRQILLNCWGGWRGEGMALIDTPSNTNLRGAQ